MFPLVRYFSLTSLIVFVLAFIVIFFGMSRNALNIIIGLREESNIALTRVYADTILNDYGEFIATAENMSAEEIMASDEFLALDADLRQLTQGSNIIKIKIYALNGLTIYSSEFDQIGEYKTDNSGFQAGLIGDVASELTYKDTFNAFEGNIEDIDIVESYVPLQSATTGEINGVIELYDDVTNLLSFVNQRIALAGTALATLFITLYAILYFIVRYAQKIMSQQRHQIEKHVGEIALANTNLQIANAQAKEATRLKSEFLSTMSHELRTPLNAIIGYSGIITSGIAGDVDERAQGMVKRIQDSGQHLLMLINNVLDISKIEAGRLTIVKDKTDIHELVASVEEQLQVLADEKSLTLNVDVSSAVPTYLMIDSERVKQIIINLLSNAIKFTEEGTVSLTVDWKDHRLDIDVSDTGIGIPAHSLDYIFDEFRQVDGSSTRTTGGTGLGLAIVRKFTEAMDGQVSVRSTLNQGTTFNVVIDAQALDILQIEPQTT
ncbi:MAG: ATP-binding protein [Chloroflexota bacterium]